MLSSSITPGEEIKAFECPVCKKIFQIKDNSTSYVSIHGNINLGEKTLFVNVSKDSDRPCRVCIKCLCKVLEFKGPNNSKKLEKLKETKKSTISEKLEELNENIDNIVTAGDWKENL